MNDNNTYHLGLAALGAQEILSANKKALDFSGYRPTYKQLSNYDHLIDRANLHVIKYGEGGLDESLVVIKDYIKKYSFQVRKLAHHLKGNSQAQTIFNIWHWCKINIAYAYDEPGKEQLRTPARSWADRFTGIDCDDYAILISCMLRELHIPYALKIVAFNGKDSYSHIYVVSGATVLDAVMNAYNSEPPGITKSFLVDVEKNSQNLNGPFSFIKPHLVFSLGATPQSQSLIATMRQQLDALKQKQNKTATDIRDVHKLQVILSLVGVEENESAGYLLKLSPHIDDITPAGVIIWKDDIINDLLTGYATYDELDPEEKLQIKPVWDVLTSEGPLSGLDEDNCAELGYFLCHADKLEGSLGAFKKLREKRAAKLKAKSEKAKPGSNKQKRLATKAKIKAAKASGDKTALAAAKKERKTRIKENAKKVGRIFLKIDPIMATTRGAYLAVLRMNWGAQATKLKYIRDTPSKKAVWDKVLKVWKNLGGDGKRGLKRFSAAIDKGWKKKPVMKKNKAKAEKYRKLIEDAKPKGTVKGLGAPPAAAAVAAATGIITAIAGILAKFLKKDEAGKGTDDSAQAIANAQNIQPQNNPLITAALNPGETNNPSAPVDENKNTGSGFPWKWVIGTVAVAGTGYLVFKKPKRKAA